jgi:hypothetical protein
VTQAAESAKEVSREAGVGERKKEWTNSVCGMQQHRSVLAVGPIGVAVKHYAAHWTEN